MLTSRPFLYGVVAGFGLTFLYHHFAPGKGIGQPGQITGGSPS